MEYKIYSAEYKLSLVKEFQSRNMSMRGFCKEKDICLSTFIDWLKKVEAYGETNIEALIRKPENNLLTPIDVTTEVKKIVNDGNQIINNAFTLEIKGMKLTFAISNLKEVLEVIK